MRHMTKDEERILIGAIIIIAQQHDEDPPPPGFVIAIFDMLELISDTVGRKLTTKEVVTLTDALFKVVDSWNGDDEDDDHL